MASPDAIVHSSSSSLVTDKVGVEKIERTVNALLKWRNANYATQLLEQEDFILFVFAPKKDEVPCESRIDKIYYIPLPHSLNSGAKLCLIIDDRAESNLTLEAAITKIKDEKIPIKRVVRLSKLKNGYKHSEAQRMLYNSYDMFFADTCVIRLLPRWLRQRKLPVPVDLGNINWKEQIERACSSTVLHLVTGVHSELKVGKASMEIEDIVENVVGAIEGILGLVPGKWEGVYGLRLRCSKSFPLSIYRGWAPYITCISMDKISH